MTAPTKEQARDLAGPVVDLIAQIVEKYTFAIIQEIHAMTTANSTSGIAWLIECGSPAAYYCGPADWCGNANHAKKFSTREAAEAVAATMRTIEPVRVCDHVWV